MKTAIEAIPAQRGELGATVTANPRRCAGRRAHLVDADPSRATRPGLGHTRQCPDAFASPSYANGKPAQTTCELGITVEGG